MWEGYSFIIVNVDELWLLFIARSQIQNQECEANADIIVKLYRQYCGKYMIKRQDHLTL